MIDVHAFRLLFVCHANECRSPMAERLARRMFADRFGAAAADLHVISAGTHARPGRPMRPDAAKVLGYFGADATGFASRPLGPGFIEGADLILTATREQRSLCVTRVPDAIGRAFTIRQFGRMAAAVGAATPSLHTGPLARRLHVLLALAVQMRDRTAVGPEVSDDLADPVGRPEKAFRQCAMELHRAIDRIIRAVTRT